MNEIFTKPGPQFQSPKQHFCAYQPANDLTTLVLEFEFRSLVDTAGDLCFTIYYYHLPAGSVDCIVRRAILTNQEAVLLKGALFFCTYVIQTEG